MFCMCITAFDVHAPMAPSPSFPHSTSLAGACPPALTCSSASGGPWRRMARSRAPHRRRSGEIHHSSRLSLTCGDQTRLPCSCGCRHGCGRVCRGAPRASPHLRPFRSRLQLRAGARADPAWPGGVGGAWPGRVGRCHRVQGPHVPGSAGGRGSSGGAEGTRAGEQRRGGGRLLRATGAVACVDDARPTTAALPPHAPKRKPCAQAAVPGNNQLVEAVQEMRDAEESFMVRWLAPLQWRCSLHALHPLHASHCCPPALAVVAVRPGDGQRRQRAPVPGGRRVAGCRVCQGALREVAAVRAAGEGRVGGHTGARRRQGQEDRAETGKGRRGCPGWASVAAGVSTWPAVVMR